MKSNGRMGVSSTALNAAAPEKYGFPIEDFDPINVRGELTQKAKDTMRLQATRQAMKVPLYQVFVTDENNEPLAIGPKRAHETTTRLLESVEIAINTGQIKGWRLPRMERVAEPAEGLGLVKGLTPEATQGIAARAALRAAGRL